MEFTLLLDSPRDPRRTVQIAKLGEDFEHSKYGKFSIAAQDIEAWRRNLDNLPGRRALIDEDHSADRTPRRTEASGWITDVRLEAGTPMADVEWTPKGEQAVREGRYLFISPTFGNFTDENGQVHENTLIGAALTNRPFLNMPSLCLASEERVSEAIDSDPAARFYTRALDGELGEEVGALVALDVSQAERDQAHAAGHSLPDKSYPINNAAQLRAAAILAGTGHGDVAGARKLIRRRASELGVALSTLPGFASKSLSESDSRRPMDDEARQALLKTLDLADDVEDSKILEAVSAVQATAKEAEKRERKLGKNPVKTLEQQAADRGLKILDAAALRKLELEAAAGAAAAIELKEQRFDTAFERALEARKVTPAERDGLHHFYTLDADATLASFETREAILPEKPAGRPALELDDKPAPDQLVSAGLHPDGHELRKALQRHMLEKGLAQAEFPKVLDQYMSGQLVLG